jgi:tetratricopeptide (TPR) repeat protein
MNKKYFFIIILSISCILCTGCMKLAIRISSPALFTNLTQSLFEECDTKIAESSIPANLKILEGLLKSDPENRDILRLLSMGFCGYSLLFVEKDDPSRASELYLRASEYGLRALGYRKNLNNMNKIDLDNILKNLKNSDIESFLWTTVSWNSWVGLNLDRPVAVAQFGLSFSCIEKLLEMEHYYLYGTPHILMGASLSARPPILGGDYSKAKENFETALTLSKRNFFLAQYYYARYYCVGVQDRELFIRLLNEVIKGNPGRLRDVCLINSVIQKRAKELLESIDDFFI